MLIVALGAGGYLLASGRLGRNEVLLEARAAPGPNPFTPPLGPVPAAPNEVAVAPPAAATAAPGGGTTGGGTTGGGTTAGRPNPGGGGATAAATPPVAARTTPAVGGGAVAGRPTQSPVANPNAGGATAPAANPNQGGATAPVALVGGPEQTAACQPDRLISQLKAQPGAATAWGGVLHVRTGDIDAYVGQLRAGSLQRDTRFTNHGFRSGAAEPRQSVLQVGTAVLLDPTGVPVVRCTSGSPLLPPVAVSGTPTFTGPAWPGFSPGGLVASSTPPQSVTTAAAPAGQAVSPAVAAGAGPNLVVNGGFTSGLVAPWGTGIYEPKPEVFWGTAQATAVVVNGGGRAHGRNALLITNQTAFAPNVYRTASQQVHVIAGRQYCLSFWTQGIGGPAGILSMPLDKAWAHRVAVPPGSFAWTQFAGTATAEGSTFDVRLITENKGSILVDDIELTAGACTVSGQLPAGANPRAAHQ